MFLRNLCLIFTDGNDANQCNFMANGASTKCQILFSGAIYVSNILSSHEGEGSFQLQSFQFKFLTFSLHWTLGVYVCISEIRSHLWEAIESLLTPRESIVIVAVRFSDVGQGYSWGNHVGKSFPQSTYSGFIVEETYRWYWKESDIEY